MRTRSTIALVASLVVLSVGVSAANAQAATDYIGNAYGTYANVGSTVVSGPSAYVTLGCDTTAGVTHSNTVLTAGVPELFSTGVVTSSVRSIAGTEGPESASTADVHNVNLVKGLITASEVKALSTTSHDPSGFDVSAAGSSFGSLVVNGHPVAANAPPNTTINFPGGKVVLNEQSTQIGARAAAFTVNMIHVYLSSRPGVTAGTQIIVGHAYSALSLFVRGTLDGLAYGTYGQVGNVVTAGRSAAVYMPCLGTNGNIITNSVASVTLPKNAGETGTVTDTAQGSVNEAEESAETTSTVKALQLANGLITAEAVKAGATASKFTEESPQLTDTGSFLNLTVNGTPVPAEVPANTKISLAGITVWLHRVIETASSIEVRMVEIVVTGPNASKLATGTDIRVAVAEASAH